MYTIEQLRDINAEMLDYAIKMLIESSLDFIESTSDELSPVYDVPYRDFYPLQADVIDSFFNQLDRLGIDYTEEYNAAERIFLQVINNNDVPIEKIVEVIGRRAFFFITSQMLGNGTGIWEWDSLRDIHIPDMQYVNCYNILVQIGECYSYQASFVS